MIKPIDSFGTKYNYDEVLLQQTLSYWKKNCF